MIDKNIREIEERYACIIPDTRVKIWNIELEMWKVFDEICQRYHLTYYFLFGNLIGAVRHQGFVPWDDDIDVVMPRNDYDQFALIAQKELGYPYYVETAYNHEENHYMFMRIINENTTCIHPDGMEKNHQGLRLDITPLDGIPNDKKLRKQQFFQHEFLMSISRVYQIEYGKLKNRARILKLFSHIFFMCIPYRTLGRRLEKIRSRYSWDECEEVGDLIHGLRFKKEDFSEIVYLDFEGYKIPAPSGYERILKEMYGNYMTLPPKNMRILSEAEVKGWILEPDISFREYLNITKAKSASTKGGRKKLYHKYCD